MKKRVLAAMMACAMAAGLLSGCSSEPKNPGDSNEPVTTAAAGQTEAGDATAAAQEESGPKIFHDYMTTDVDNQMLVSLGDIGMKLLSNFFNLKSATYRV